MDKSLKSHNKIGIFDSGLGGLTVMSALTQLLPNEEIFYYADTAHLPYGDKTPQQLLTYCKQAIDTFAIADVKLIILACHTVCSNVLNEVRAYSPIPILSILEEGIEQLVTTAAKHIAVLTTQATFNSGTYQKKILERLPHVALTAIACPLFVPLVEEGRTADPLVQQAIQKHLHPLKNQPLDTVLLGCTHYPLLHKALVHELGEHIPLLNPATTCAFTAKQWLKDRNLLNPSPAPNHQFHVTANPSKFHKLASVFTNAPLYANMHPT